MNRKDLFKRTIGPWLGFRPWRRHSLVLMIGGLVCIGYGGLMCTWTLDGPRAEAIVVLLRYASLEFWAAVWIAGGFLACLSSRWPTMSEKWGYGLLTGYSAAWSAAYFAGALVSENDLSDATGGLVWALIAFLWWAITGLMNPDRVVIVEVEASHGNP